MPVIALFRAALVAALFLMLGRAFGQAYEAKLPEDLATHPQLCERVACAEVFPGAARFSARKGRPAYVEALDAGGALLGYVFLSTDITDLPAYSGKPVVTLIGMDRSGRYVGTRVLKHSEPILLLGIPDTALTGFMDQYRDQYVGDEFQVGGAKGVPGHVGLDAISGATVTVIAQNQVMVTSGQAIARQVGILAATVREPARYHDVGRTPDWRTLVAACGRSCWDARNSAYCASSATCSGKNASMYAPKQSSTFCGGMRTPQSASAATVHSSDGR